MMISKQMAKELNSQLNAELYSAYLYMSMASYAAINGFQGAANWFSIQTKEELAHSEKFYEYINSHGEQVILESIAKPPSSYKSLQQMFSETLQHEQSVTASINRLATLAIKENDHATAIFLQWFVTEQVEEEENVNNILAKLKLAGTAGGGLFMIDKELAGRVFVPPTSK